MTTLTPTNLIAVEVPKDATQWKIDTLKADEDFEELTILMFDNLEYIKLPSSNFEIIGEVNKDEIDTKLRYYLLKNYSLDDIDFRSLLQSNGIYFENPIGKEPNYDDYVSEAEIAMYEASYHEDLAEWQSYESKLIKGKLIILKQK